MTPQQTTVYVPCNLEENEKSLLAQSFKPLTGYFLTTEEMEEVKREAVAFVRWKDDTYYTISLWGETKYLLKANPKNEGYLTIEQIYERYK